MFKTELDVVYIGGKLRKLDSPLIWVDDDTEEEIVVPAGFVTDFASVPRLPVVFMLFGDCAHAAAVVHDYLYQTHRRSKPASDWIFFKAMKDCGEPLWRRMPMYMAVVTFGWFIYYNKDKRSLKLYADIV